MITAGKLHVFGIQHHVQPVVYIAIVQMKQITKPERFLSIFVAVSIGDTATCGTAVGLPLVHPAPGAKA